MEGDQPMARLVYLPNQNDPATGFGGKLKAFLTTSDRGMIGAGDMCYRLRWLLACRCGWRVDGQLRGV